MTRGRDITGERSGLLVAISRCGRAKSGNAVWLARCDCGNETRISTGNFGVQQSCGCITKERMKNRATHGHTRNLSRPIEYVIWDGMKRRCRDQDSSRYGGRGIKVCNRWLTGENGKTGFECFLDDMGSRPSSEHSIDRYPDNDGNYEPSNCRWATDEEQGRNKSNNHIVIFRGDEMPVTAAADAAGLNANTVFGRIKLGWSSDDALNTSLCHPPYGQAKDTAR